MRCRNCEYPLWNLKARQCPECGEPFKPSEFEFTPQSVRFCCPHCDHPYYGTDERGFVVPQAFACLKCGQPVTLDEMVLRPGLGVEERRTAVDRMPWLERRERGRVRAWFETVGRALSAPIRLMEVTPAESSLAAAWTFGLVTWILFTLIGTALPYLLYGAMMSGSLFSSMMFTASSLEILLAIAAYIVGGLVAMPVTLGIWIGVTHVILWATGRTAGSIRRTAQPMLYSSGANLLSAVPCCGVYVGWMWWGVSAVLMVKEAQRVSGVRATFAVFCLPGVVAAALGGLLIWGMTQTMGMAGMGMGGANWSNPTYVNNFSLMQSAGVNAGAGPDHAIELSLTSVTAGWTPQFCDPSTQTQPSDVPLGDGTLADFDAATRSEKLAIASSVLKSMPANLVAHRFGDFVFTYHGVGLNNMDPQLWTMVMLPDPDVNPTPGPGFIVQIGTTQYQVTTTTFAELPGLLEKQNAHRATLGLPALPDLMTVTHDEPACANGTGEGGDG